MTIITSAVLLLAAVVGANIVGLLLPKVPLALFQIAAGLILSLDPMFNFKLDPEIFMLIIIAPLMFNDGQNQSLEKLSKNVSNMLSMAVSLVLVTIILTGVVAHSVWSALPLSLAFMLAAIITPTDAVAVESITQNVVVPSHVHNALEHESLFNDASGIVLFDLALASFVSGNFSLSTSVLSFLKVFLGGLIVGWILGMLIVSLRMYLTRTHTDISAVIIPINVMTPLFVYWIAERLGVSGILAVVAAGLAHGMLRSRLQLTSTKLQIVSNTTWTILADILNGFVFVLLGTTLPHVIMSLSLQENTLLFGIGCLLYVLMFAIRYCWVRFRLVKIKEDTQSPHQTALQVATGGIHGTITLAMAFSIPTVIAGHAFAFRDQIIFIAAVVILISLLVATIVYPLILAPKKQSFTDDQYKDALNQMVYSALEALRQGNPASKEIEQVSQVITSQLVFDQHVDRKSYMQLMEKAQKVELETLDQLTDDGEISEATRRIYQQMLSRISIKNGPGGFKGFTRLVSRQLTHRLRKRQNQRKHKKLMRKYHQNIDLLTTDIDKFKKLYGDKMSPEAMNKLLKYAQQRPDRHGRLAQLPSSSADRPVEPSAPATPAAPHDAQPALTPDKAQHTSPFHDRVHQQRQEIMTLMDLLTKAVVDYLNTIQTADNLAEVNIVRNSYLQRTQQFRQSTELDEDYLATLFIQVFQAEHTFIQERQASQQIVPELANRLNEQISTDELVYMQNRV